MKKDNTVGEIMGLAVGEKAYLEFDIVMKETAKIGDSPNSKLKYVFKAVISPSFFTLKLILKVSPIKISSVS